MTATPLILWGAKGHAKVLREFLEPAGYSVVAVFDNDPIAVSPFPSVPLYLGRAGFVDWLQRSSIATAAFCIAIGGARGKDRLELHDWLAGQGLRPIVAVHPRAFVAGSAGLGTGSQVLAGACVCAEVSLGRCCIVNTGATVDHESVLGDGVHIAPGATVTGCVEIGENTMIGAGAVVLPGVRVGANSVVGAGSVVTQRVPDNVIAFGHPARIVRENR